MKDSQVVNMPNGRIVAHLISLCKKELSENKLSEDSVAALVTLRKMLSKEGCTQCFPEAKLTQEELALCKSYLDNEMKESRK